MCGIVGAVSTRNIVPILVEGLRKGGVAPEAAPKIIGEIGRDVRLRDYHAAMKAK